MKKFFLFTLIIFFLSGCVTTGRIQPSAGPSVLQDKIVSLNNINYVPLIVVCDRFNYKWSWDTVARKAGIQNKNNYIRFAEGSSFVLINNSVEKMESPTVIYCGAVMIPVSFAQAKLLPKQKYGFTAKQPKIKDKTRYLLGKVAIDAGHGGKDPGAIGRCGLIEKDVALDIAKRLKEKLESEGFQVYLTRSSDKFIQLSKRPQIANSQNADFFVSIHINAAKMKSAKGFEIYYLSEAADESAKSLAEEENASLKFEAASYKVSSDNNLEAILWDLVSTENRAESIQLANYILKEAKSSLWVNSRGVKSANFYVLKGARMPAILVEAGFISNRDEEERLKDPDYREKIADAIAKGILNYREEYQAAEGFTK